MSSTTATSLFLVRDFLDPSTCARLLSEVDSSPVTRAPVYIEGSDNNVHEEVRKTSSLHPSDETIWFVHHQLMSKKHSLEEHFGCNLTDCEKPQFLRYQVGDFFVRHQDGNTEQLEFDHLRVRRISIVVFLNNSSREIAEGTFCGGSLNFYDRTAAAPSPQVSRSIEGETGLLVAFSAHEIHEVTPVVHGERFTIISWFR